MEYDVVLPWVVKNVLSKIFFKSHTRGMCEELHIYSKCTIKQRDVEENADKIIFCFGVFLDELSVWT